MPCLEKLKLLCCYSDSKVETCDSSEAGMGCVSCLRMLTKTGVQVAFVIGKSKVVPKAATLSIPRLELQAALIAAQMHCQIKVCILLPLSICHLYTDSTVVLDWLSNTEKRLKKCVVKRVAERHCLCAEDQWHHVATIVNVADLCSGGIDSSKAEANCVYLIKGPKMLYETNMYFANASINTLHAKTYMVHVCNLHAK